MTMRLCFGIDPGATGAIAALADGDAVAVIDMPMYTVKDQSEVDALAIARFMREQMSAHSGAYVSACIERVRAMPAGRNGDGSPRKQGAQTMFVFGDNYGKVKAVLEMLRIPYTRAEPQSWKRHYRLIGGDKDAGRMVALLRFPAIAHLLMRKKDHGRADAALIGLYHDSLEIREASAA